MTDKLREEAERLLDAYIEANTYGPNIETIDKKRRAILKFIARARAEAIEEAAKVAETPIEIWCCKVPKYDGSGQPECCGNPECRWGNPGEIAAAIRALKEKTK